MKGEENMNDLIMRRQRVQNFEENVWLCERTEELIRAIEKSRKGMQVYLDVDRKTEERMDGISYKDDNVCEGRIERVMVGKNEDLQLEKHGARIGVACFVSAFYPGGDAIRGGSGGEEFLCRQSTLYPCLNTDYLRRTYYETNLQDGEEIAAKYLYIPDVVCTAQDNSRDSFVKEYGDSFDVICCARTGKSRKGDMERMLMIARQKNIDVIIFMTDERDLI